MLRQQSMAVEVAKRPVTRCWFFAVCLAVLVCNSATTLRAQTTSATLSGTVMDPNGRVVLDVEVSATNIDTGVASNTRTNGDGIYVLPALPPGHYRVIVTKTGFKQIALTDVVLNVQDTVSRNFNLEIGAVSETVMVTANDVNINTTDATVSTVVDRQFAENLPLNGRSFQTLIYLSPGVVVTPSTPQDSGQFSVNGQRAASNYWMVDGVSANIGIGGFNAGEGFGGALGSFSAQGGTNSLVSVDAMQEFRIQTSTYAPEFGRVPGGQISILTRSGGNQFHGTAFDYLRNDALDANNWFADQEGLPKPTERQNDFGGTFSGPIIKDRTFFFFSYEGLRLQLPQVVLTTVPDTNPADPFSRQFATPTMQPFLNAYPLPNGPEVLDANGNHQGIAEFNSSFSNKSSLDAYSLRVDHKPSNNLTLFGRYNYSPSSLLERGLAGLSLSDVSQSRITTQTATIGITWIASPKVTNELRFNYSRVRVSGEDFLDGFGGAVPFTPPSFPAPFDIQNSFFALNVVPLIGSRLFVGALNDNLQQQINLVDNVSVQEGSHSLKFGVDYRRLSPEYNPYLYFQSVTFSDLSNAQSGTPASANISSNLGSKILFRNLGVFAQDTWRLTPRLTMTYGLRWDLDFTPSSLKGPSIAAVTGFDLNNLSNLALAPAGTQAFKTTYGNVAPRIGLAYQMSQSQDWQSVLRGGFGVFFDLATQEVGNTFGLGYPFYAVTGTNGVNFPLDAATATPPAITPANLATGLTALYAFDPNLKLPYTLQWNVAIEQGLGKQQTITASYIGASGKRVIQSAQILSPTADLGDVILVTNAGVSNYNALQVQFQRRLSRGLQVLASYTWSHCIDTGSTGSFGNNANTLVPADLSANRGPCDFDIRNAFSAGVTYEIPAPRTNAFATAILGGWSLDNIIQARSAPPVDVWSLLYNFNVLDNAITQVRPDVVAGIPLYLYGSQCTAANGGMPCPGGKAINFIPGAVAGGCPDGSQSVGPFCPPPVDINGNPLRQGDLGRNALRGFGATHLYQIGGPRSIQFALKLFF
jgi:outer membrane receptor protein involved in Fe transport